MNMATPEETEATVMFLASVYPNQTPPNLEVYERMLQERGQAGAMLYAAETWYASPRFLPDNKFWPTPADLLKIAEAQGVKPLTPEYIAKAFALDLAAQLGTLEELFFQHGTLEERTWLALEAEYKKRNRLAGAENVRTRLLAKKQILAGTQVRKDYEADLARMKTKALEVV